MTSKTEQKPDTRKTIEVRKRLITRLKKKKPKFRTHMWKTFPKLGTKWRHAKGRHNKVRKAEKSKIHKVRVGYGTPSIIKHFHPSGYEEIHVNNVNDISTVDPNLQVARISSTVGKRKKELILNKADELGIKVLNR